MSEEKTESPLIPFYMRIEQAQAEERAKLFEKKNKSNIKLSESEIEIADSIISLFNDKNFKVYLKFESLEIAERLANSFSPAPDEMIAKGTLGEQLAFNKGRHYQMMYIKNIRNMLANSRLQQINNDSKKQEEKKS